MLLSLIPWCILDEAKTVQLRHMLPAMAIAATTIGVGMGAARLWKKIVAWAETPELPTQDPIALEAEREVERLLESLWPKN